MERWEDLEGAVFYNPCPGNQPPMYGPDAEQVDLPHTGTMIALSGLPIREMPSFQTYELCQRIAGDYVSYRFSNDIEFVACNNNVRYGWAETNWETIAAGIPRTGDVAVPGVGIFGIMQDSTTGQWVPLRPYGQIARAVAERKGPCRHRR